MMRYIPLAVILCITIVLILSYGAGRKKSNTIVGAPSEHTDIAVDVKTDIIFPPKFIFGAATSSSQTEGAGKEDGTTVLTDWSPWMEKQEGRPPSAQDILSVDYYHRYPQDFDLARQIGLNSIRISVEWARIEPNCDGKFDAKEMAHYAEQVRALVKRGVVPFVNLNHFSLPLCYAQEGGWLNPQLPIFFARYATYVAKHLRGVEWWMTINEPMVIVMDGYIEGRYPPGKKNAYSEAIRVLVNLLDAHREAYRAIHAVAKMRGEKAMVGMASFTPLYLPASDSMDDTRAADLYNFGKQFFDIGAGEEEDYIGINYYSRHFLKFSFWSKLFGQFMSEGDGEKTDTGTEIYPKGIYEVIRQYKQFKKPIIITENGLADAKDTKRASFILAHLYWVHKAMEEGADVRGYFVWSLTDTYEWNAGFGTRFGLIAIDFEHDLARSIRPSAFIYGEVCRTKKITSELWRKVFEKK
jgi:beta-glucosidase